MSSIAITTTYVVETDQNSIKSANRGAITTAFSPPTSCISTLTKIPDSSLFFGNQRTVLDTACYPKSTGSGNWDSYYYSPAICPLGWIIATTFSGSSPIYGGRDYLLQYFAIGPETTAALCCPSAYTYWKDGHQCSSAITYGQSVTFFVLQRVGNSFSTERVTSTKNIDSTWAVGDGIPIWWQSTDMAVLARASLLTATPSTSLSTPPTPGATTSAGPSSSLSPIAVTLISSSSSLSTGAMIGIGVSIPVVVIAGLLGGYLLWRHKRRTRVVNTAEDVYVSPPSDGKYLPPTNPHDTQQASKVHSNPEAFYSRHELPEVQHR